MERIDAGRMLASPKPIIGMVHALPLPGAPAWGGSMERVLERAARDAAALTSGGVDGIFVENYGDAPFYPGVVPPETIAALTMVVAEVMRNTSLPVGVNVLRNDASAALAIAAACGASMIRINVHTGIMHTDQGTITGAAHETVRQRMRLAPDVALFADVLVKHATPPAGLTHAHAAADTWERGRADALIVSGRATGAAADIGAVAEVREAVPDAFIIIGSGLTAENAGSMLRIADAAIVGSALEEGGAAGRPVELDRVRALMDAVNDVRAGRTVADY